MKKVFSFVAITSALLILGNTAGAQQKFGHASLEDIVSIMPDIRKADSLLQKFRTDSLENTLPFFVSEYKRKDSIAKAPSTPAAIKQTVQQEANNYLSIIQNWDQYQQSEMQRKQAEVLNPYFAKAFELISTVAKENGYTWVFKQDALLVAPQTDDLLPLVAKKLGVKLQPGATGLDNPASEPAKPAAGAKKP
ncbi:OmpH family outer membrane protein [Agriterribacter sp.]|uniref:OmpH family outer membrane protein n=1 Tax=Agriterribacter sp. TaxID=2821509 RepID=UPI002C6E9E23|nr:OmpH family outer membrane protein [Agriterribacter sp.]HRO44659.1 OmpH family outer membrane protein [Agriterribacter sp.]HRQ16096.1 OmpH family outer membrane protein [Agriterribacter sp.]